MNLWEGVIAILGLGLITVLTRSFFLIPKNELPMPMWLQQGLRYAPLAALSAVIAPEVLMSQGQFIHSWQDARLPAVLAASGYYFWRKGILGTILSGTAVLLFFRLVLNW
jgi:branched-subunit amino acid transport protein